MTENEAKAVKFIENIKDHAVVTLDHIAKEEPNVSPLVYKGREEKANTILTMIEELKQYRAIGMLEELQKVEKEENILKFYYCDSEDSYLVGLRIGNFYYAHYGDGSWVFHMSRYLPFGKHVVDERSLWKEHTYPSEPREINFSEWLKGFVEKECGGTPEECRKSVEICKSMIERNITPEDMEEYMKFEDECISEEFTLKSLLEAGEKQKAKRPYYEGDGYSDGHLVYDTWICPCCGKHYEVDYDDYDFCPACGQCIDWSNEE